MYVDLYVYLSVFPVCFVYLYVFPQTYLLLIHLGYNARDLSAYSLDRTEAVDVKLGPASQTDPTAVENRMA